MTEISKEYLDQKLSTLVTKQDLDAQTKQLKAYADEQTEKLPAMLVEGFEEIKEPLHIT